MRYLNGESGIRTHAPLRTNGFQDRLVMTTSISLHVFIGNSKRFVRVPQQCKSYYIQKGFICQQLFSIFFETFCSNRNISRKYGIYGHFIFRKNRFYIFVLSVLNSFLQYLSVSPTSSSSTGIYEANRTDCRNPTTALRPSSAVPLQSAYLPASSV